MPPKLGPAPFEPGIKTLPLTRGEIMANPEAIRQALLFLQRGHFTGATAEAFACGY
ncbi:hypothetical protein [Microbulbifer guangxiensis]|uniref:hypothetical protein n=1 Tax=Microbulbifer guangxiensis TaxID=2904249 RepID=UPI001F32C1E9|nr:hypothetical protein [Microbulbifer guangxiensis]